MGQKLAKPMDTPQPISALFSSVQFTLMILKLVF